MKDQFLYFYVAQHHHSIELWSRYSLQAAALQAAGFPLLSGLVFQPHSFKQHLDPILNLDVVFNHQIAFHHKPRSGDILVRRLHNFSS
jgi:hypothetical protein